MRLKFKLCEDLETDLIDRNNDREMLIDSVRNSLTEIGFEERSELNGVSFDMIIDSEDDEVYCQFYLDTDNNTYKSYVSKDGDNKVMFTQTGDIKDVLGALDKFVKFVSTI